jgi:hypothetical protein
MDLTSKTPEEGLFDSNSRLLNLEKIEDLLSRLAPPKWPEEVLGKIDRAKVAECVRAQPRKYTEQPIWPDAGFCRE